MWDNTLIKITHQNIRVLDSLRGSNCFFYRKLCNSYREVKNESNLRTKRVKQKFLKIIKVNVPSFFLFWLNLRNEGAKGSTIFILAYLLIT